MEKSAFVKEKNKLQEHIDSKLKYGKLASKDNISLKKLSLLMKDYTYENRLIMKGLVTRTILDSLEISYALGEKFIEFDKCIT